MYNDSTLFNGGKARTLEWICIKDLEVRAHPLRPTPIVITLHLDRVNFVIV